MARPSDKDVFLNALKAQGNRVGNTALQRELKWNEAKYWQIHHQLFEAGLIEKGRGYGGSVKLAEQAVELPATTAADPNGAQPAPLSAIGTTPMAVVEALVENYTSEAQLYPRQSN